MADMQNHSTSRYAFLSALDIEQLEQLLKTDYSGSMSEDAAEEFIDAIIEVMVGKERENPTGRFADIDKAWTDFQNYYNVPDRKGQLLYPDFVSPDSTPSQKAPIRRSKHILRWVALVAAAIGIFMSLLVVAQAAGFDVFGAMARWTRETFNFTSTPVNGELQPLRTLLEEQDIPAEYAPTYVPKGFYAETPEVIKTKKATVVSTFFSNGEKDFSYVVTRYSSKNVIDVAYYEKEPGGAIPYTNNRQLFYIFENTQSTMATWFDGDLLAIDICGSISTEDMKLIIDSIGG